MVGLKQTWQVLKTCQVFLLLLAADAFALDWETWDNSVIRLLATGNGGMESGTAFAINSQGDYVTNHHVIEKSLQGWTLEAVESVEPQLKTYPAQVIWHDASRDLAVVRVADWRNPPLRLAAGNGLRKDTPVVTLGFPGGSDVAPGPGFTEPKLKRGVVSAVQTLPFYQPDTPIPVIEHDAVVNSGNSGGPLADNCGRVVGVNSAKAITQVSLQDLQQGAINLTEGTFWSISSNEVMAALRANHIAFSEEGTECAASPATPPHVLYGILGVLALIIGALGYLYSQLKRLLPAEAGMKEVSRLLVSRLQGRPPLPAPPPRPVRDLETGAVLDKDKMAQLLPLQAGMPVLFLRRGSQLLGREDAGQADVLIPHPQVSARHLCLILNPDGTAGVEDLHSTNGSQVDKQLLAPGQIHPLRAGQVLRLGSVSYRFEAA